MIFEEALKKQNFKMRELIVHLAIKVCLKSVIDLRTGNKRPTSFFDIYEGKLKYLLELETH